MKKLILLSSIFSFSAVAVEKVNITRNEQTVTYGNFNTHEEAVEWFNKAVESGGFGKPEEYAVEYIDVTAQLETERIFKEAKKAERTARIQKLKDIDWTKVTTIASLKDIFKELVKETLKDEE